MNDKKNLNIFAAITLITALGVLSGSIISPIEVRFLQTLTPHTSLIGAKFSIYAALSGIFSLAAGRLAYKYGKRGFIAAGAILGIAVPLFSVMSSNIFQYIGMTVVAAFSGGVSGPLISSIFQNALSKNKSRGKYMGIYYAAFALMGSIGAFIGGVMADSYGLRAPYYADVIVCVVIAAISLYLITKYKNHAIFSSEKHLQEKRDILFSIRYIFKDPALIFHLILRSAFGIYWAMKPIIFPLAIYSIAKSNTATGTVFASMGIIAMIILPFAGHYVDKKGYLKGAKIGFAILGISSLALAFSNTLLMFFLFASTFAIGEAINGPMAGVIEVKRIKNHHRSELMGFYYAHSALLSIISPLVAGILLAYLLISQVLLAYSLVLWLGIVCAYLVIRNKRIEYKR